MIMEGQARTRQKSREENSVKAEIRTETRTDNAAGKCPHCGAALERDDYEFCPVCGEKLVDYCTFCGAAMSAADVDCPECGMPSEGIVCRKCGTRNFRPFCRDCGQPLSLAAQRAVEKAKQDPKVLEAARLMVHLSELQAELDGCEVEDGGPQEPTEGELRLQELMAKVGFTAAEKPKAAKRGQNRKREEVLEEYRKAVEDANKVMEEMLPPAGSTPQEQRNYYTARKVAMMEVMEERWYGIEIQKTMGWECNKCHVLHNNPSECAVREFGGKWITCSECKAVPKGTSGATMYINKVEKKVYKRE